MCTNDADSYYICVLKEHPIYMKLLVLILFFAALLADVYIYRSIICSYFKRLPARIAYIIYAIVTDGAALTVFFLYSFAAGRGSTAVMAVMWMVWAFFVTAFPKLLFAAGGFLDGVASLIFRRRVVLFRSVMICLSAAAVVMMIYGATAGRTKIKVNEVEICSDRVPEGFDGYRILQFSDLHIGTMPNAAKRAGRMAERINGLQPDMVVNTGDLVNISYADLTPEVMSQLSLIGATDGVWSVWGNHDLGFYIKDTLSLPPRENLFRLSEKVRALGWRTLSDESVYIRRRGDSILLSGLNYPSDGMLNGHNSVLSGVDLDRAFGGYSPATFSVVLSHTPQMWRGIMAAGFGDLTLSGHVHSMQIKLSLGGRKWSPAKYLYGEWSGYYVEGTGEKYSLYVNDGMGCVGYPMRIGATPELTIFILKRCE